MPTTKSPRKPSMSTERNGHAITATRLNPEHKRLDGRQYQVSVDGAPFMVVTQVPGRGGHQAWTWPGGNTRTSPYFGTLESLALSITWTATEPAEQAEAPEAEELPANPLAGADTCTTAAHVKPGERIRFAGLQGIYEVLVDSVTPTPRPEWATEPRDARYVRLAGRTRLVGPCDPDSGTVPFYDLTDEGLTVRTHRTAFVMPGGPVPSPKWPTCPDCGHSFTIVLGLPVTLTGSVRQPHLVEADLDREIVLDEDATLSCGCGSQEDWTPEQYDRAAELLEPAVDALIHAPAVTLTYDLRPR